MCGIFGIVTESEQVLGPVLIEAGHRLSYRGYDSVGCATLQDGRSIDLRKDIGKVDDVSRRLGFAEMAGNRGILQLRWATFGSPSTENAQPHLDSYSNMVGAHNGNIVNHHELRQEYIAEGMTVRSDNDGETCVHAVERYVNQGFDIVTAIRHANNDLAGDYSFVIGQVNENQLYAIKKGSGLVVGIADTFTCVSSDLPSILPLTRRIIRVEDGEIVSLWSNRIEIRRIIDGELIERQIEIVDENMDVAKKGGYAHFMLKEIYEQPGVAGELLRLLQISKNIDGFLDRISNARYVYLVGCGTSYHACLLGSIYLAQLANRHAIPILATQFIPQYGPTLSSDDVGIFVSQSGETKDVLNAIDYAKHKGVSILGLVNVIGSSLARTCDHYLPLTCGYEISVPATKTFTNQTIIFLYLATRLGNNVSIDFQAIPGLLSDTLVQAESQVDQVIISLSKWPDSYCLGYGLTYPIALEGALKLKEITYTHCEGMLSTEFKHGPLSAVTPGFPVIFIASPQDIPLLISGINETTCRSGNVILIGPDDRRLRSHANHLIAIPKSDPYSSALISILPLQLLSYKLSLEYGYNPDFPRNLSKTLTVD